MPLKVLIVPDKFKGTLTAAAAAESIGQGWKSARPRDELELLPMSDGGDGFGEVMSRLRPMEEQSVETVNAAHAPIRARWWWHPTDAAALIESANIIGLALLPPGKFHPFQLDTFGLGAVLRAAAGKGARSGLVGIGGSATNDGGFGMARSLGWEFLDRQDRPIDQWPQLTALRRIRIPKSIRAPTGLIVAVDVQNSLIGPEGASRVYGPQKGLRPEDFKAAEDALATLAEVVRGDLGRDAATEPGAGAAGGLGFGLRCFANARLESGFDLFARDARLRDRIRSARVVVTAEGAIDRSTLMGKGVGEVARICRECGVPCIGLAGALPDAATMSVEQAALFAGLYALSPHLTTRENAVGDPRTWLMRLSSQVAANLDPRWAS